MPRGGDFGGRKPTLAPGLGRTEHISARVRPVVVDSLDYYLAGESLGELLDRIGLALAADQGKTLPRKLSASEVRSLAGFARRLLAGSLDGLDSDHAEDLSEEHFNLINSTWQCLDNAEL